MVLNWGDRVIENYRNLSLKPTFLLQHEVVTMESEPQAGGSRGVNS